MCVFITNQQFCVFVLSLCFSSVGVCVSPSFLSWVRHDDAVRWSVSGLSSSSSPYIYMNMGRVVCLWERGHAQKQQLKNKKLRQKLRN